MKIIDHLKNKNDSSQFTFEILPPLKGQNLESIFDAILDSYLVDRYQHFSNCFLKLPRHRLKTLSIATLNEFM